MQEEGKVHLHLCEEFGNQQGTEILYKMWNLKSLRARIRVINEVRELKVEKEKEELLSNLEKEKVKNENITREAEIAANKIISDPKKFRE